MYAEISRQISLFDFGLQRFVSDFERQLRQQLKAEEVPGAAWAIVKDGAVLSMNTHGVRKAGQPERIGKRTLFRIASLSKGVTGVLAAKSVEAGELSWSTPLQACAPSYQQNNLPALGDLQLQHFLTHTTGLPRHTYSNLLNMGRPYSNILSLLPQVKPSHAPGLYHNYQNVIFNFAADMMEEATALPFDTLVQQRLFQPLGMRRASVGYGAIAEEKDKAWPHARRVRGYSAVDIEPNYYEVPAAAGVNASISDMAQWLKAVSGHAPEVLPDSLLKSVFAPHVPIPAAKIMHRNWDGLESGHYAMGWRVFEVDGEQIIGHSGYVNGYRAEIAFMPASDIGMVILTNAPNRTVGNAVPEFFSAYRMHALDADQP